MAKLEVDSSLIRNQRSEKERTREKEAERMKIGASGRVNSDDGCGKIRAKPPRRRGEVRTSGYMLRKKSRSSLRHHGSRCYRSMHVARVYKRQCKIISFNCYLCFLRRVECSPVVLILGFSSSDFISPIEHRKNIYKYSFCIYWHKLL